MTKQSKAVIFIISHPVDPYP